MSLKKSHVTAYRHITLANRSKVDALVALFPAFRSALGVRAAIMRRQILKGDVPLKHLTETTSLRPFVSELSRRQQGSAYNMAYGAVASWRELLKIRVRELITGSELPESRKTLLYRLNAREAWWVQKTELPWSTSGSELVPCNAAAENAQLLPVDSDDLKFLRRLAKQAQKRVQFPNLRRVNTLRLDASTIATPTRSRTAFMSGRVSWWVQIATLTSGKPVRIPLVRNPYFEIKHAAAGTLCGAVQLHLVRDNHNMPSTVAVSLLLEHPVTAPRTVGTTTGIDFGVKSALFATSDGQLLGHGMLRRLRELDAILEPHVADLQRRGVRLKTDPYYQKLQARIRGYVTNEIGRLLNQIAARDGDQVVKEIVVERLDFRGGGLSRRMNRLITRTGRGILKTRLEALTTKHGISVAEIPSPYSSQECSGCGYVHAKNRRDIRFRCGFCGNKLHADVNAARVIQSRRSRHLPEHTGPRSRKKTLQILDNHHRKRWNLPETWSGPSHERLNKSAGGWANTSHKTC